jgi:hypothetical protein
VERVAPGERKRSDPALKARNTRDISAFQALFDRAYRKTRGDVPRFARHLPLAFIFRAFGALFQLFVQSIESRNLWIKKGVARLRTTPKINL